MKGTLYILSTPIGNRQDITLRALDILKKIPVVAAEDTRKTGLLLKYYGIEKKHFISCHRFNERQKAKKILNILNDGNDVALVTDSGTPCISDPGSFVVNEAHQEGIKVIPIPGPCAVTTAFSVSGLKDPSYSFIGFLGKKRKDLIKIKDLLEVNRFPVLFYESPKRVMRTLARLQEIVPQSTVVFCRELTKLHEEVLKGKIEEILEILTKRQSIKGEIVIAITISEDNDEKKGERKKRERENNPSL